MSNKIIKPADEPEIYRVMRRAYEGPGEVQKFMRVKLEPGERIDSHQHRRHAVLYYPEATNAHIIIKPQPGTIVYLPPGTIHSVPQVERHRQSIAMLIADA